MSEKHTIEICKEERENYRKYVAIHVYPDGSLIMQYDVDRKNGCNHGMYQVKNDGRTDIVFGDASNGAYTMPEYAILEIRAIPGLVEKIREKYPWQREM